MTSQSKQIMVKRGDGGGTNHRVQDMLAGNFTPLRATSGNKFQMYMKDTGDWWMNFDGNMGWLKIYEV